MTEAALAREWTAFGGASLGLMGAALALGARGYARDHAAWQRERNQALGVPAPAPGEPERLTRGYRVGGVAVLCLGALVFLSATFGIGPAPRVKLEDARVSGLCLALLGVTFAGVKLRRGAPRWADASDGAVWALCALWAIFGMRLFLGAAR